VNTALVGPSPSQNIKSVVGQVQELLAGAWNKVRGAVGLTGLPEAHVISGNDYVKDPKTGKMNFSWNRQTRTIQTVLFGMVKPRARLLVNRALETLCRAY